jgi:hypothetical protein
MVGKRTLNVRGQKSTFREVSRFNPSQKSNAQNWANAVREDGNLVRLITANNGDIVAYANPDRLPSKRKIASNMKKTISRPKPRIFNRAESQEWLDAEINYSSNTDEMSQAEKDDEYSRLRRFSFFVGTVHFVSGLLMLWFANSDFVLQITSAFAAGPPGCVESGECEQLIVNNFGVTLAYAVAAFSLLSAFFHYLTVVPGIFENYVDNLEKGRNPYRWVEYSLSSTLMILIILLVSGISNLAALIGVGFANISMILFGWVSEIDNPPEREKTNWTPFIFGCIAGLGAWAALYVSIYVNLTGFGIDWSAIPGFVWFIIFSQFALFNCFAINHALQFQKGFYAGGYLTGERIYIWLSLIAKSLLAWTLYVNTLIL